MALAKPILIGCAGFSYPGPRRRTGTARFIRRKDQRLRSTEILFLDLQHVEINSTFYRPASVAMTKNWAAKTPADFSFAIKLWQKFTHPKKLGGKEVGGEWEKITQQDIDNVRAR